MTPKRFAFIDLETTDLSMSADIVEIGVIVKGGDKVLDRYETFVRPVRNLSAQTQEITGIRPYMLDQAPEFFQIANRLLEVLEGCILVAHQAILDIKIIERAFSQVGIDFSPRYRCTLELSKKYIPGLNNYTLEGLSKLFDIEVNKHHRAMADALATSKLYEKIEDSFNEVLPKLYLPLHQKMLNKIPRAIGVLKLNDADGKLKNSFACFDMAKKARQVLEFSSDKALFLSGIENIDFEIFPSYILALIRHSELYPDQFRYVVDLKINSKGIQRLRVEKGHKARNPVMGFKNYFQAKREVDNKIKLLKAPVFRHREWSSSARENRDRKNDLIKSWYGKYQLPSQNFLVISKQGIENSFLLVRESKLIGWGKTSKNKEELIKRPEDFLLKEFENRPLNRLLTALGLKHIKENTRSLEEYYELKKLDKR